MKILVIGGLHGNEPLGVELVKALELSPIPNVDALFGNPAAIKENVRFVDADLNRVFPGKSDGNKEERRAAELMRVTEGYNVVLDFHNTNASNNDCGFVGGTQYETLLPVATALGIEKVVVADYDCINKYVPTCISVEVSLPSTKNSVGYWIEKIRALVEQKTAGVQLPTLYRFAYRVTTEQQKKEKFVWEVFEAISTVDAQRLGLSRGTYYPIFVNDEYTPNNYAGLVSKI